MSVPVKGQSAADSNPDSGKAEVNQAHAKHAAIISASEKFSSSPSTSLCIRINNKGQVGERLNTGENWKLTWNQLRSVHVQSRED